MVKIIRSSHLKGFNPVRIYDFEIRFLKILLSKGKCGVCGDAYHLSRPRPNEHGGKFGTGKISKSYLQGQVRSNSNTTHPLHYTVTL